MNKDEKHEETGLAQVLRDIRALIDESSNHLVALRTVTPMFIAACAGWQQTDSQNRAAEDRDGIDELIDHAVLKLNLSESVSQAVRNVSIGLKRMSKRNILSKKALDNLRRDALFDSIQTNAEVLCRIHDWLHVLDLSTPGGRQCAADVFDDALRFMVARDEKFLGEFVTPKPVAELMLELAGLSPGESVYDPCFGFGELLVGASRRLKAAPASSQRCEVGPPAVSGVETQDFAHRVTLCRLLLAGIDSPGLECGDALKKSLPDDGSDAGFDCIVAAPPWGQDSIAFTYDHFPFPSAHAEDLFLQHVMAHVRLGGRAVVALPERPLFHTESAAMRRALLSKYRVEGVVSLPAGAFEPCTSISTSIIVFSRREPGTKVGFVIVSPMAWEVASAEARDGGDGQSVSDLPSDSLSHEDSLRDFPICRLIGDRRAVPAGSASPGVDTWDVPISVLALSDYELLAKKSGNAILEAEIQRVVDADHSLTIKRLDEVADVVEGQENDAFDIADTYAAWKANNPDIAEDDPEYVAGALLRPADVIDVEMRRPSYALTNIGREEMPDGAVWLREGDLLVPMEETVGSIGLIEDIEDWSGVVADRGIALIRVRDGIRPQFLAALLRSPAYWFWLSGHAAGSMIRRLSTPVLRTLRVPVPPLSVQDAVLKELSEPRADALAVLYRLLAQIAGHPVALWLETPLPAKLLTGGAGDDRVPLSTLSEIAQGIRSVSASGDPETYDQSCSAWLAIARKASIALDGVDSIPPGSGRLAVLQIALARFHESIRKLEGAEGTTIERLRSFTGTMVELAERAVHDMQHVIDLDVGADPTEVTVGAPSEVCLRVRNASVVPLRDVLVSARLPDGVEVTREIGYLHEQGTHDVPIQVRPQDARQSLRVAVSWQARRVEGTVVDGEEEVLLLVNPSSEGVDGRDLGDSPYIVGNPVVRDGMFFGRADQMGQIRRQLGGGDHANVILLEGNRRTGKTSILRQLGKADALPGWIPVYCSLQDVDSVATSDVFRLLALRTGWTLADVGIETWIPDLPRADPGKPFKLAFRAALHRAFSDEHPFETLEVYLATVIEAAKPRRILLMLDEFDKLQEGIDGGITSPQVPENIRHLLHHQPGLGAIITGSRRLKRLREEYWSALFGFGYRIGVSALPKDGARRLVTKPVAGRLRYLPQACDRLVELCACHPFLIQSLCSRVFDRAATGSDRTITLDIVERSATEMVRDNEHFQTLWGYAGTERRRLILALCDRLAAGSDPVNIHLLRMEFDGYGLPVRRDRDLADDIAELRELELVYLDTSYRNGTYRLSIPLMAKWLKRNVDFDDLVVRAKQEAEGAL